MALIENENEQIQDLVIPGIAKKRFRINGDNSKILELNTSDMNIIQRLTEGYQDLKELASKVAEVKIPEDVEDADEEEQLKAAQTVAEQLKDLNEQMGERLDFIFDSNVSEVCAGNANLYDPLNGKFRWEHIIDSLGDLYGKTFKNEFQAMSKRVEKHTSKYIKSNKRKKG